MKDRNLYPKDKRRLAWRVFKYFVMNEDLLNEENAELFKMAQKIVIDEYIAEHKYADENGVEKAIVIVAKWENKAHPDYEFKLDDSIYKLLLKSE